MQGVRGRTSVGPTDQIALIALCGVVLAVGIWAVFAAVDAVMLGAAFVAEFIAPSEGRILTRLITIVVVLMGTLLTQSMFARRFKVERRLKAERARADQLYEQSPDAVMCLDPTWHIQYSNPAARALFVAGSATDPPDAQCYRRIRGLEAPCEGCLLPEVVASGEVRHGCVSESRDGVDSWFEHTVYPVFGEGGALDSVVEVITDISEQVSAHETIRRMAYYDELTKLPNRLMLQDRLKDALVQARRRAELVAVAIIDIDDFKRINDTLGYSAGDAVLKEIAARFQTLLREEDTVARQSGDEFTVVARITAYEDVEVLADRILGSLRADFVVDGCELSITASIGMAVSPRDGETEAELIQHADMALHRAQEWGHNVHRVYSAEMGEPSAISLGLESMISRGLDRGEFELYYQPQIDQRNRRFVGMEALIRWNHPTRGVLSPAAFLDSAERAGLMERIGPWVLETACRQGRAWNDQGLDFGRMAVNLSAREFVQYDVAENVARTLLLTGMDPSFLELEITESAAVYNANQALLTLAQIQKLGVRVAMDDFGTGYSSMSNLKRLPIQTLKIAQAFMRDVHTDTQSAAIASLIIGLCHELGLEIVAEGVEHKSQLDFLSERGCYVIQGFIFSPPIQAGDAGAMLIERNALTRLRA